MANSTTITKKVLGASGQAWHYVMSNVQITPGVERCAWGELRAAVRLVSLALLLVPRRVPDSSEQRETQSDLPFSKILLDRPMGLKERNRKTSKREITEINNPRKKY